MEQAERSIKFGDGNYQRAILWKESNLLLPDNYSMAFQKDQMLLKFIVKSLRKISRKAMWEKLNHINCVRSKVVFTVVRKD